MNMTVSTPMPEAAPAERHIHVDLDVDPEHNFHYRSRGADGHRVALHRADSITFTSTGDFSIWFTDRSPFESPVLHSRHSFITARVRDDVPFGAYAYTVEVVKDEQLYSDPQPGQPRQSRPEIIIER